MSVDVMIKEFMRSFYNPVELVTDLDDKSRLLFSFHPQDADEFTLIQKIDGIYVPYEWPDSQFFNQDEAIQEFENLVGVKDAYIVDMSFTNFCRWFYSPYTRKDEFKNAMEWHRSKKKFINHKVHPQGLIFVTKLMNENRLEFHSRFVDRDGIGLLMEAFIDRTLYCEEFIVDLKGVTQAGDLYLNFLMEVEKRLSWPEN